ncbi:MAG: hypothetical protein DCO98_00090 [Altererythrobacter sp. XM-24bin4]|nr:MAG: hypothetical protein DCO98_00090 [Altererythrobacter sp. XM-24bin4]
MPWNATKGEGGNGNSGRYMAEAPKPTNMKTIITTVMLKKNRSARGFAVIDTPNNVDPWRV